MTSVSVGHLKLTPTQPVGSEQSHQTQDLLTRSHAFYLRQYIPVPKGTTSTRGVGLEPNQTNPEFSGGTLEGFHAAISLVIVNLCA